MKVAIYCRLSEEVFALFPKAVEILCDFRHAHQ